jgi:hypothetical protein
MCAWLRAMRRALLFCAGLLLSSAGVAGCSAAPGSEGGGEDAAADGASGDASPRDAAGTGDDASSDAPNLDGAAFGVTCSGASPSFARNVHPILQGCGGELCHGGTALGAWPYSQLVNAPITRDTCRAGVIVSRGSLQKSYLMNKLTGIDMCPGTARMPVNGTPLSSSDTQTIADWICQGAANN